MLSIYSNPFQLQLKLQHNNNYQKISVKDFLEIPQDSKNIYCKNCKQWIDLDKSQTHKNEGHNLTNKMVIPEKCDYHSYRTSKVMCINCNLIMCSLCYESFVIHKNHMIISIDDFKEDKCIDSIKNFLDCFKEKLFKIENWLYNIIIQQNNFKESKEYIDNKDSSIINILNLFIRHQQTQEQNELFILSQTLLFYIDLFNIYSKLSDNYTNKKTIINYSNIIKNIYEQQTKLKIFDSFTNSIDYSSEKVPLEYFNNTLFQPFMSMYSLNYISTISLENKILCITILKSKVVAIGSSIDITFHSFFEQTQSFIEKGKIDIEAGSIQEGKDGLIYLSTYEGIEIITLNSTYTSYTKVHSIKDQVMKLSYVLESNVEPIGKIILSKQQDIIYYINFRNTSCIFYFKYKRVDQYDLIMNREFDKLIYKVILTGKTGPILVCCFSKGIKIISLDTKEIIIKISNYLHNPIEFNDEIVLCFGTKKSMMFHNLSHSESVHITLVNNEGLNNYNGIKFEPLLLEGNVLLMYNGTQFNVVELMEQNFLLHNSAIKIQMDCKAQYGQISPLIIHKDLQNSNYLIAVLDKITCKLVVLQLIKN